MTDRENSDFVDEQLMPPSGPQGSAQGEREAAPRAPDVVPGQSRPTPAGPPPLQDATPTPPGQPVVQQPQDPTAFRARSTSGPPPHRQPPP
ncbi:MAG TPA: hypothetical protein VE759_11560, partial [Mycobacterium sp.]|nr:hypothetical protein [Mycobacterium sp.]